MMIDEYFNLQGSIFPARDLQVMHALLHGETYPITIEVLQGGDYVDPLVSTLRRLHRAGFTVFNSCEPTFLSVSLRLMDSQFKSTRVKTFRRAAIDRELDISPAACKRQLRKLDNTRKPIYRLFPTVSDVRRKLIDCNDSTENLPSEEGDRYEFSSRTLTDWYVGQYLSLNHLRSLE